MSVGGISGSFPYYPSGKVQNSILETVGCKSVYEAEPSAVIRKEEDGIVAKSHYTEDEALWNQYMKQYRDSLKIVDGKLVVNGDPRNVLLGKVSEEELEQYRLKLEQEGIGDEIDWRGVESDFKKMNIDFDNAGYLNTKIDYIASRYAVLKDRIEKNYSGEEKGQQLSKLNEIMDSARKAIIDSYGDSVGDFYEEYGHSGTKAELTESLGKGIDQRVSQYADHLQKSESYAGLQIKDRTKVAAEEAVLNRDSMEFTVTRTLTGNRKTPSETVSVTGPQALSAQFSPDFFDKKDVNWQTDDEKLLQIAPSGDEGDYKNVLVSARKDAGWILNLMAVDDARHKENPYEKRKGNGKQTALVTVTADDTLGNRQTAECTVTVRFITDDQTEIFPESVTLDQERLEYALKIEKSGNRKNPTVTENGFDGKNLKAFLKPVLKEDAVFEPYCRDVVWETSDSSLIVENGMITPDKEAEWIIEAMKKRPYTGEHTATVTVYALKNPAVRAQCQVTMTFELEDKTYSSGGSGSGGSGSDFSGADGSSGFITFDTEDSGVPLSSGSVTGVWTQDEAGNWFFTGGGRAYVDEWAYIYNPYALPGQPSASWFRFGGDGRLVTGWFLDPLDGGWYYLHRESDGSQGHMYTGWRLIDGIWYFFGADGRMYAGVRTPDGYLVNDSGEWVQDGEADPALTE